MGLKTLLAELHHRGVYKVATVYLVVGLTALEGLTHLFHNFEAPHWVLKVLTTLLILGFPVACLMAWGFEFTPHGVRAAPAGRPMGSGSSTADHADSAQPDVAARPAVAVLPFVDMSPDGNQQYFGDGIAEELIGALSRIEGLRVAARTSTFALHAARAGMKEYGDVLHVAYVLEGSVRRAGDRVRITAQLIDVQTGYHLFSQQYDRGIADVLAIQNEIARELVWALLPKLGIDASTTLLARGTANPEAHDLRRKARQIFGHVTTHGLQLELSALLERAVALDPGYGAAWGDLSVAYLVDAAYGWSEPVPACNRATVAADRALALDPDNALALITRGVIAALIDFDHAAADAYFRRARESGIDEAFWAFYVSWLHLIPLGRYAEALEILRQARDIDPYAPTALQGEIFALIVLERLPEAVVLARTVQVEASPPLPLAGAAALCLSLAGLPTEAESLVAYVLARAGQSNLHSVVPQASLNSARHDEAANRTLLDTLMAQRQAGNYVSPVAIAALYLSLAQHDQALDWYERSADAREPAIVLAAPMWLRRDPVIGTHPRFLALLKRMHLPSQAELDAASGAAAQPGSAP